MLSPTPAGEVGGGNEGRGAREGSGDGVAVAVAPPLVVPPPPVVESMPPKLALLLRVVNTLQALLRVQGMQSVRRCVYALLELGCVLVSTGVRS